MTGVARALPGTDGAVLSALVDLKGLLLYGRDARLAGRAHLWAAAGRRRTPRSAGSRGWAWRSSRT